VYLDRSAQNRALYPVPVKPVLEAVERWLVEDKKRTGWNPGGRDGISSPMANLAQRAGVSYSSFSRTIYRLRNESQHMSMAQAERLIEATYGDVVWDHPGLRMVRPRSARGDKSWMRPDELETPKRWARRVALELGPDIRQVIAALDVAALRDVDESTSAQHRKPNREREEFKPATYAKLEQPFGHALHGKKAA